MTLQPYRVEGWGGLQLKPDPQEVGALASIDNLNVEFNQPGRVHTRRGYASFSAAVSSAYPIGLTTYTSYAANVATVYIVAFWSDGTHRQYALDGSSASTETPGGGTPETVSAVQYGTDEDSRLYALIGTNSSSLSFHRLQGTTWTQPGGVPSTYRFLASTPWDNRLVMGNNRANPHKPYRLAFSDPGDPETFGASNIIDLDPGDGEPITGLCNWETKLFVFKASKFYVFHRTNTGPDGNPIFDYYPVRSGVGPIGENAWVATPRGVVFFSGVDLWITTGGAPTKLGEEINPYLRRTSLAAFNGGHTLSAADVKNVRLAYANEKLFVLVPASNGSTQLQPLVLDFSTGQWSLWDMDMLNVIGLNLPSYVGTYNMEDFIFFGQRTGTTRIMQMRPDDTDDNGSAIASRYQSGWYDLADGRGEAYTRWSRLWGSGTPTLSVFTDYSTTDSNAAAVTLGTAPAVAHEWHLKSYKGRFFSHKLSAASGQWSVNALQHDVAAVRP